MVADVARVFLAAVFATAAGTKLRDLAGVRATLASLPGMPAAAVGAAASALIACELAVAVLVLAAPAVGLALAIALLTAFAALAEVIGRSGRRVRCACFGNVSASALGRSTVYRNGALIAVAAATLAAESDPGIGSLPALLTGLVVAAAVAMVSLCWADARRRRPELERLAAAAPAIAPGEALR